MGNRSAKPSVDESIINSSEEYSDYFCNPCKAAGENVEAQGFCINCKHYLCSNCLRYHSRNKLCEHHTLLGKDTMPKKTVKHCDPCKTVREDKEAIGYCMNCNDYMCDNCYTSHSRNRATGHHLLVDNDNMPEESDRIVTSSLAYSSDINIQASEKDKEKCYITGMTVVSSTELVLGDRNNKSLKLVDVENSVLKDVLELQAAPSGITAISKDRVAVVLDNKRQILIISLHGELSVVNTIKTNADCLDVKLKNGKLYASFCKPTKFHIIQPTGEIIQTIKLDSEVLKHCSYPRHIAVSPDECMIYVSDWQTNNILSINMDRHMLSLYQGELRKPYDITISPFGSLYFCNTGEGVIYKLAPYLDEATVILTQSDGLVLPQALCFNADKQQLYISSGSGDAKHANCIKVYQWKYK